MVWWSGFGSDWYKACYFPLMAALDPGLRALALHVVGRTYAEIAAELGCSAEEASWLVAGALRARKRLEVAEARQLEAERLDSALGWAMAIGEDIEADSEVRLKAAMAVVRIGERRAKLQMLDLVDHLRATNGVAPADGEPAMAPGELVRQLRAEADRIEQQAGLAN